MGISTAYRVCWCLHGDLSSNHGSPAAFSTEVGRLLCPLRSCLVFADGGCACLEGEERLREEASRIDAPLA